VRRRLAKALAALLPVALVVFLGWHLITRAAPAPGSGPETAPTLPPHSFTLCQSGCRYIGVALPAMSKKALSGFTQASAITPEIVEGYQAFGKRFPAAWVRTLLARKILPLIQIDPVHASLAAIAAGKYDAYLTGYGHAVAKLGTFPVALSFGHEQNGPWYPWGCHHTPPQVFVAAYRHVETVIRDAGAHHVIWVWTANVLVGARCPIMARWPGSAFVTWIGLDGYLRARGTSYAGVFRPTVSLMARLGKPVLLSEAGVLLHIPGAPGRIRNLYQGAARTPAVIGVVYFDGQTTKFGDYRPQDSPAAQAAFRKAVAAYHAAAGEAATGAILR
jgi:mannan endo-1,4-beta-mannosidase